LKRAQLSTPAPAQPFLLAPPCLANHRNRSPSGGHSSTRRKRRPQHPGASAPAWRGGPSALNARFSASRWGVVGEQRPRGGPRGAAAACPAAEHV